MTYRAECECGWSTTGNEADIVREGQAHGRTVHGFEPTPQQILAMSRPIEAGSHRPTATDERPSD